MIDDLPANAPIEVKRAHELVQRWRDAQKAPPPRRDMQADWSARLDWCRTFDQTNMPRWKNPTG
jgi:hypothetical protein